MRDTIFIIDDEEGSIFVAKSLLESKFDLISATNKAQGLDILKEKNSKIKLILLDLNMPDVKNFELLACVKKKYPLIPVIIFTYVNDIQTVVDAMKAGADDYVTKEEANSVLLSRTTKLIEKNNKDILIDVPDIFIPDHPAYKSVFDIGLKFAKNGLDFLIQSETGTGKSVLVKYIYNQLKLKGPLVDINCGAIPESLAESEFFGYEEGAYTDAKNAKVGKFELANNGILFLDEIGNMPMSLQRKILKVIEEKKLTRLGSNKEISTNFLLISATNEDLENAVRNKILRKDLFYRIHKPVIKLPSLYEYPEVIPYFIHYFTQKYNKEFDQNFKPTKDFICLMQQMIWEGNIRDIQKALKIIIACHPDKAMIENMIAVSKFKTVIDKNNIEGRTLEKRVNNYRISEIIKVLKIYKGNVAKSASYLGMKRPTLVHQIEKLNIKYEYKNHKNK